MKAGLRRLTQINFQRKIQRMGTLYHGNNLDVLCCYPRIQLRTVKELMDGKSIERPSNVAALDETFKKLQKQK